VVDDGVLHAEMHELLSRVLAEEGYTGVEIRVTPIRTEIIIKATRTQAVLGVFLLCIHHLPKKKNYYSYFSF
jgi:small subunit ribosomal protein S3e